MQNWKFMFMKKEMYIFNLELAMHKNWIISLKMEKPSKKKKNHSVRTFLDIWPDFYLLNVALIDLWIVASMCSLQVTLLRLFELRQLFQLRHLHEGTH